MPQCVSPPQWSRHTANVWFNTWLLIFPSSSARKPIYCETLFSEELRSCTGVTVIRSILLKWNYTHLLRFPQLANRRLEPITLSVVIHMIIQQAHHRMLNIYGTNKQSLFVKQWDRKTTPVANYAEKWLWLTSAVHAALTVCVSKRFVLLANAKRLWQRAACTCRAVQWRLERQRTTILL